MDKDGLIGERLAGFKIEALLGQGAMAKVYRARAELLKRDVALKVIRRIPDDKADSAARFEREKQVLLKLDHPNIMPIYDYAANRDYLWIASKLVEGGTLEDRLKKGPMPLAEVVEILNQLSGAVDKADDCRIVHRDIKPSNVMIDHEKSGDHYYLTDFGVAKVLEAEGLTAPGTTLGTPEFMSPEQVLGKPLGGPSDQYSLAIMIYQLLSGKLPFTGKMMAVMQAQAKSSPPALGKKVPAAVEKALWQALDKDPTRRYRCCADFAKAFEAAAAGGTTDASVDDVEDLPPGGTVVASVLIDNEPAPAAPAKPLPPLAAPVAPPAVPSDSKRRWGLIVDVPLLVLGVFALGRLSHSSSAPSPALLYSEHAGGDNYEIWLRGADGGKRSLGAGLYPQPWPGGKFLLVAAPEGKGKEDLFRLDLSKGERQNLTHAPAAEQSGTISPDGKSLVYSSGKDLFRVDVAGGKPVKLSSKGRSQWPSFSPNGERLAYSSDAENGMSIWVLDLKSNKKRRLTNPDSGDVDIYPAWSPDGQRLVFERDHSGTRHLRLVSLDGKEEALAGTGSAWQPSWSPCADIAFVTEQGVFSIAAASGKAKLLVEAPGGEKELLWPAWTSVQP
jgi:serine/threonine-protein kinase